MCPGNGRVAMDMTPATLAAANGAGDLLRGAFPLAYTPSTSDQLLRLKELQRSFAVQQQQATPGQRLQAPVMPFLDAGSLIPPGPSSPHDSLAPALRAEKAATSSGTEQGSLPVGADGAPGASRPAAAADDVPALPDDFPDIFGELNVPSLEELVQDVVTAEAELVSVNRVIVKATELVRSQTMPPSPAGTLQAAASAPAAAGGLPSYSSMPVNQGAAKGARRGTARGTSSAASLGAGTKRKSPSTETADIPTSAPSMSLQQHTPALTVAANRPTVRFSGVPDSPFQNAQQAQQAATPSCVPGAMEPRYMSAPAGPMATPAVAGHAASPTDAAPAVVSPRLESLPDDQALLDTMSHQPRVAATPQSAPPIGRAAPALDKAASVPASSPWLSPAAAIHAATASRPGDREVLDWLLFGK